MIAAQWQCVHANNDFHVLPWCAEERLASSYLMSPEHKRGFALPKGKPPRFISYIRTYCWVNVATANEHSQMLLLFFKRGLASSKIQHDPSGISLTCLFDSPDEIQRWENTTVLLFGPQIPLVAQNREIDFLSRGMRFCHISAHETEA